MRAGRVAQEEHAIRITAEVGGVSHRPFESEPAVLYLSGSRAVFTLARSGAR
jgi:hypothetical protein